MKILIISRAFYPMNSPRSFRTTELVKEFCRRGHDVTLYTIKDNDIHTEFEKEYGIRIKDLGPLVLKKINLSSYDPLYFIKKGLRRFGKLLLEYPDIELSFKLKKKLKHEGEYDLLISIAAPHPIHWGVAMSRTNKNRIAKVWVADCGDPYMGQENDTFRPPFYFKYIEKYFCKKADYISVPTQGSIKGYYNEFHDKIRVIPQGFDFDSIAVLDNPPKSLQIQFAYSGGFIPNIRDPRPIIEHLLKSEVDFRFHIFTKQKMLIKNLVEKSNGKIIVHEFIPRELLLFELSKMDFLINIENKGDIQTPSKLIDYAIVNRPILSINSADLDEEKIDEFLVKRFDSKLIINNIEDYKIQNVVTKFIELCD